MANKGKNKRKNSSNGGCAKTSKSNHEAKSGSPEGVSDFCLNSVQHLYSLPYLSGLSVGMNSMNSSFNGSVFGSPVGQLMNNASPYPMHTMNSGVGLTSPPGQCHGGVPLVSSLPPYNMANFINPQQSAQPMQPLQSVQQSSSELMRYLNSKFDEVNK